LPPLVDVLHRLLWLVEHHPAAIGSYLDQACPDYEWLRFVNQNLAGNGEGGAWVHVATQGAEALALRKLTINWRTLVEAHRGALV
jgi:putative DNA methylase